MKTIFLIMILTCSCVIAGYSQVNPRHKNEKASSDLPAFRIMPNQEYSLGKPNEEKKTRDLATAIDRLAPGEGNVAVEDHMPCYEPEGVFSMRIVKPDSTVHHTMPVKKF